MSARPAGSLALVIGMNGGGRVRARLESMGLVPGTEIRIMNNGGAGPLLISTGEGRLTIGRGIAEKILVA
ncbi:FeoA family protein [Desulfocurvus sp. DL9XJH121]